MSEVIEAICYSPLKPLDVIVGWSVFIIGIFTIIWIFLIIHKSQKRSKILIIQPSQNRFKRFLQFFLIAFIFTFSRFLLNFIDNELWIPETREIDLWIRYSLVAASMIFYGLSLASFIKELESKY